MCSNFPALNTILQHNALFLEYVIVDVGLEIADDSLIENPEDFTAQVANSDLHADDLGKNKHCEKLEITTEKNSSLCSDIDLGSSCEICPPTPSSLPSPSPSFLLSSSKNSIDVNNKYGCDKDYNTSFLLRPSFLFQD
ncbi:hypothetical protein ACFE04_018535 [Oxalis oulophora]